MQAIFETAFDIVYLVLVITLGIRMIRGNAGRRQYLLFGIMAVTLGCGDAFHLIPRAVALCTTGLENYTAALGIGKLISRYEVTGRTGLTAAVWVLALVRIALCLMPQNAWTSAAAPLAWGIYRNIPFAILGGVIVVLFYRSARERQDRDFRHLWLTVVLSFACYIPVVLFADAVPMVGMLMVPKTCAYIWTVLIGYQAMKKGV